VRHYHTTLGPAAGPTCPKILAPPLSVECSPVVRLSQHPQSLPASPLPRRRRSCPCRSTRGTLWCWL